MFNCRLNRRRQLGEGNCLVGGSYGGRKAEKRRQNKRENLESHDSAVDSNQVLTCQNLPVVGYAI